MHSLMVEEFTSNSREAGNSVACYGFKNDEIAEKSCCNPELRLLMGYGSGVISKHLNGFCRHVNK